MQDIKICQHDNETSKNNFDPIVGHVGSYMMFD